MVLQIGVEWGVQIFALSNLPCYGLSVWVAEVRIPSTAATS